MARYKHKRSNQLETVDPKSALGKILESSPTWIRLDPDPKPVAKPKPAPKKEIKKEIKKD